MSTIPPRPWTGHSAILRDANGNHIADVSIFGTGVRDDIVTALHIADAVNAFDGLDAAIDAAQFKVVEADLQAEAAESRADDLAAPKAPLNALEWIEKVLGLPPSESSETEVIWQVCKLRQRAEAAEADLAELRTAADRAADDAQVVVCQVERRAEAAESRADDLAGRLRIAEEEIGRLRAKLAAVGVGDV